MGRHEGKGARFRFGGGIGVRGRLWGGGWICWFLGLGVKE